MSWLRTWTKIELGEDTCVIMASNESETAIDWIAGSNTRDSRFPSGFRDDVLLVECRLAGAECWECCLWWSMRGSLLPKLWAEPSFSNNWLKDRGESLDIMKSTNSMPGCLSNTLMATRSTKTFFLISSIAWTDQPGGSGFAIFAKEHGNAKNGAEVNCSSSGLMLDRGSCSVFPKST